MGIFKKNPNEANYPNGRKPALSVIKNEGSPDLLMWKVPYEDFNVGSQVIVNETEDALFVKNGRIEQIFSGGSYVLDTDNYPFLSRIRNVLSDGVSVYNCKVFFVNKVNTWDNLWGTSSPVPVTDKILDIETQIQARGSYVLRIVDSHQFVLEFAGLNKAELHPSDLSDRLRRRISGRIENTIGQTVQNMDGSLADISGHLSEIEQKVEELLDPYFTQIGLHLQEFLIEHISPIEDSERAKLRQEIAQRNRSVDSMIREQRLQTAADKETFSDPTTAKAWQARQNAEIFKTAAANQGNNAMGLGMGLGMSVPAFTSMMNQCQQSFPTPQQSSQQQAAGSSFCSDCGVVVPAGSKFCPGCGKPQQSTGLFCPSCGAKVPTGSKYCPICGGTI